MTPLAFVGLVAAQALVAAQSLRADTLVLQERGTFARSYIAQFPDFREEVQASEAPSFQDFQAADTSTAQLPPAITTSSASLDSRVEIGSMHARGAATSTRVAPDKDRYTETPADSFFEVLFDIEEEKPFRLQGQVDAVTSGGEGFASVELIYFGIFEISQHKAGGGEFDRFDDTGSLAPGRYRLTALALAHGEVDGETSSPSARANFQFALTLPEPTPDAAAAVSLLALAALARARRRYS
jgi:hypothetical protein